MAQHLWIDTSVVRVFEVCAAMQLKPDRSWQPHVSPICPGDEDDGRRADRRSLLAPAGLPRVLEAA